MGLLSETKTLVEILKAAGGWLRRAHQRAERERDRSAAQLLHDAFVLAASMRVYDNALRPLLGQLLGFSASWDKERRGDLYDKLVGFFDREEILPHFRQALASLSYMQWDGAGGEALHRLVASAFTFDEEIAGTIRREKENYVIRIEMLSALQLGASIEEESLVRKWAERIVGLLDRGLLVEVDASYGELRQAILAAHDLPDPGYAIALQSREA